MRMDFTECATQINNVSSFHLAHEDQHSIASASGSPLNVLYAEADETLRTPDGTWLYHAPVKQHRSRRVDVELYANLRSAMSRHFLGAIHWEVQENPELFIGLPFWSLVAFDHYDTLFPPHLVPRLSADFTNVSRDREDREFIKCFEPMMPGLGLMYTKIESEIHFAKNRGGSFLLRS